MNSILRVMLYVSFLMLFCAYHVHASNLKISPEPQKIIAGSSSAPIIIDNNWVILFDDISPAPADYPKDENPYHFSAKELINGLKERGINLHTNPYSEQPTGSKRIILGNPLHNQEIQRICQTKGINVDDLPYEPDDSRYDESYILDISNDNNVNEEIIIIARGAAGVFYGVQTLLQLIDSKQISPIRIIDFPDMKWRGLYLSFKKIKTRAGKVDSLHLNQEAVDGIMREVKSYAKLKLNTIIFLSSAFHAMDSSNTRYLKQLCQQCRKVFINAVPSIQSKIKFIPENCEHSVSYNDIEAVWTKDEEFIIDGDGIAKPLEQPVNIIQNNSFEIGRSIKAGPDNWKLEKADKENGWFKINKNDQGEDDSSVKSGHGAVKLAYSNLKSTSAIRSSRIHVRPESYYEIGFWAKRSKRTRAKITVSVNQYNSHDKKIRETLFFNTNFGLETKWGKNWTPIFTHSKCSYIEISFTASKIKSKQGDIYVDDIELTRMNGTLINVLRTPEADIVVKNSTGKTTYMEGEDYIVQDITLVDKPDKTITSLPKTTIVIPVDSRLKTDDRIKVSYDAITLELRQLRSKYCPSSSGTYVKYKDQLQKIIELNPSHININLDEHYGGYNRDSRCRKRHLSNAELFAGFINNINDILHKEGRVEILPSVSITGLNRPDIRLVMWDDMINYWHNGGGKQGEINQIRFGGLPGSTYLAMPNTPVAEDSFSAGQASETHLSSDIILASWWYRDNDKKNKIKNGPEFFEKRGFEYFASPWDNTNNIMMWAEALSKRRALGMITTTWDVRKGGVPLTAEYSWKNIIKRVSKANLR